MRGTAAARSNGAARPACGWKIWPSAFRASGGRFAVGARAAGSAAWHADQHLSECFTVDTVDTVLSPNWRPRASWPLSLISKDNAPNPPLRAGRIKRGVLEAAPWAQCTFLRTGAASGGLVSGSAPQNHRSKSGRSMAQKGACRKAVCAGERWVAGCRRDVWRGAGSVGVVARFTEIRVTKIPIPPPAGEGDQQSRCRGRFWQAPRRKVWKNRPCPSTTLRVVPLPVPGRN